MKFIDVGTKTKPRWINPDRVDSIGTHPMEKGTCFTFSGMGEEDFLFTELTVDEVIARMKDRKYHILVNLYDIPRRTKSIHDAEIS